MKFLKLLEKLNRYIVLNLLKIVLRNKEITHKLNIAEIDRMLLIRFDVIGDMLITLPLIKYLKSKNPKMEIDCLCSKRNYEIIKNDKIISNIYIFDENHFFESLKEPKKRKYDFIFSLVFNRISKSGLIANYINRKAIKATILSNNRKDLYQSLFNIQVPVEEYRGKHKLLETQIRMAAWIFDLEFNIDEIDNNQFYIEYENEKIAVDFMQNITNQKVIFNISAGRTFRIFSEEKNIEILTELSMKYPYFTFIISYDKSDIDKSNNIYRKCNKNNVILAPKTNNFQQIAALIKHSDYVVTPDTSIVHISAIFQKPLLIFYSLLGSSSEEWEPFKTKFKIIKTNEKLSIESLSNDDIIYSFGELVKN